MANKNTQNQEGPVSNSSAKQIDVTESKGNQSQKISGLWTAGFLLAGVLISFGLGMLGGDNGLKIPKEYLAVIKSIPTIIGALLALFVSKLLYQYSVTFNLTTEMQDSDNPAIGLCFAGYILGVGLAMVGATLGQSELKVALINAILGLAISIPLMLLAGIIHDKLLLSKFSIVKELQQDRNLGTGAVCCGAFIATGLILYGSFLGPESNSFGSYLFSILGAYVIGQIIFLIGGVLFQFATSYDFHYEIEHHDNAAAGVLFGSFLVGLGLVVSAAIAGLEVSSGSWFKPLVDCFLIGMIGMFMLLGAGIGTAKLIFPRVSLDEEVCQKNSAIALVLATVYLTVGFIVQALLRA